MTKRYGSLVGAVKQTVPAQQVDKAFDRTTLGVVEIALLAPPDATVRDQFGEMTTLLALNLEILRRHAPAIEVLP